jgi:hypothetical protein
VPPNAVLQTLTQLWPLLQSSGVPVAIAGGIALSYWGNPRSTQDIDLAMYVGDSDSMRGLLIDAGFHPTAKSPKELGLFLLSQWVFEPAEEYVDVEVDLMMSTSDYYAAALGRTKRVDLVSVPMPVAVLSREDLILHKLYAERLIDQADVANLMEMHWGELDQNYLESWSKKLGLEDALVTAIEHYRTSQG